MIYFYLHVAFDSERCYAIPEEGSFVYDELIVFRNDAKRNVLTNSKMATRIWCFCRQQKRSALITFRDLVDALFCIFRFGGACFILKFRSFDSVSVGDHLFQVSQLHL